MAQEDGAMEGRWLPQFVGEVILDRADALQMAEEIVRLVNPWMGFRFRDRQILVVIEDFRARQLQGAALRVLETIGVLRYVLAQSGCRVELLQHGEWRADWTAAKMRRIAAQKKAPGWMIDLKEHELDAARMAWVAADARRGRGEDNGND